jgi:hypothetical protein
MQRILMDASPALLCLYLTPTNMEVVVEQRIESKISSSSTTSAFKVQYNVSAASHQVRAKAPSTVVFRLRSSFSVAESASGFPTLASTAFSHLQDFHGSYHRSTSTSSHVILH